MDDFVFMANGNQVSMRSRFALARATVAVRRLLLVLQSGERE